MLEITAEDRIKWEETEKKLHKIDQKGSEKLKNALLSGEITVDEAYKKVTVHVSNNTGKYEWHTPPKFIEAARKRWVQLI